MEPLWRGRLSWLVIIVCIMLTIDFQLAARVRLAIIGRCLGRRGEILEARKLYWNVDEELLVFAESMEKVGKWWILIKQRPAWKNVFSLLREK